MESSLAEPVDNLKAICKICQRQLSKYTCPTCNVPYCSLTCFRFESHSKCSETFYKKEVESDIQSDSRSSEERLKMLELLKKFETENSGMDLEGEGDDDDDDDDDDLVRRFEDVDLSSTCTADIWSRLMPGEQKQFMKVLQDPTSELARQLLASDELENDLRGPWWEASVTVEGGTGSEPASRRRHGLRPDALRIPSMLVKPWPSGPSLTYNICAICIAYSYTTRHLAISPLSTVSHEGADFQEAQRLISHLVPFLVDRKSTTIFPNLSRLVPALWSRFQAGEMNSTLFSLLLRDTVTLIRPLPVTMVSLHVTQSMEIDPTSHPHLNLILVLSDLSRLFELSPSRKAPHTKPNHVKHKLVFYAAHILSTPSPILWALAEEISQKTLAYEETSDDVPAIHVDEKGGRAAIIEEV